MVDSDELLDYMAGGAGSGRPVAAINEYNDDYLIQSESSPLLLRPPQKPSAAKAIWRELTSGQRIWTILVLSILAANTALLGGYTLGYPSSSLLDLKNLTGDRTLKDDPVMQGLFGAIAPIGAVFGGAIAGWSIDGFGRKPTLILTGVPNFIGYTLLGVSWFINKKIYFDVVLLLGRFLTGFGIGWSMFSAPVYIAEVSSPALRGLFSSLPLFIMNIGILLVYGIGMTSFLKFYHTAFIASGISLVVFVGTCFIKETPRFLVAKGLNDRAKLVLKAIRGPRIDVKNELNEIETALSFQSNLSFVQVLCEFKKRDVWLPFTLLTFLMMFRQFSGINALIFYADPILKSAHLKDIRLIALMTVGVTEVLMTFVSTVVVDLFGRKILLIISAVVMALSSAGLGMSSYFEDDCTLCQNLPYLTIISLTVFIFGVSIGYDSIPYILIAEMIPLRVRGVLGGILSAFHWLCAVVVAGLYLFSAGFDGAVTWWTFAVVNVFSVAFVAFFLPETKGKKLEAVEREMAYTYRLCS